MLFLNRVPGAFATFAFINVALSSLTTTTAKASTRNRADSIRAARVWEKPAWISSDFQFARNFDFAGGPAKEGWELTLESEPLQCRYRQSDSEEEFSGMTMKFYCGIGETSATDVNETADDELKKVKFKYKFSDGEIASELMATRLFWALGFGADKMYAVPRLECFGCSDDPFFERDVDPSTAEQPRVFEMLAAERKFKGSTIDGGWTYDELMSKLPKNRLAKQKQLIERDALRLLSVFVQHADNKAQNQNLVCLGEELKAGGCTGETVMLVHDLGATFGSGQIDRTTMSKAQFEDWDGKPLWSDPSACEANLGLNAEGGMENPVITEEARTFLSRLLTGFSSGPDGRERVRELFRNAHAELRGGTIEQWTRTFLRKVSELEHPTGASDFECPSHIESRLDF